MDNDHNLPTAKDKKLEQPPTHFLDSDKPYPVKLSSVMIPSSFKMEEYREAQGCHYCDMQPPLLCSSKRSSKTA